MARRPAPAAPTSPVDVREHLVRALEADLVGPFTPAPTPGSEGAGRAAEETLPLAPSRWYHVGFLAPEAGRDAQDPTDEDELGAGSDEDDEEDQGPEPEPKQKHRLPASIGVSVLLRPGCRDGLTATVSWADYVAEDADAGPDPDAPRERRGRPRLRWRRVAREPATVALPLDPTALGRGVPLLGSGGVRLVGAIEDATAPGLPPGTRALAVFVVNGRAPIERPRSDEACMFQVQLGLTCAHGFEPRPNRRDEGGEDWDDCVADLQFRDHVELAVGHGVSVDAPRADADGVVRSVRTTWLPRAEVRRVKTYDAPGVVTSMEKLAELTDGAAVRAALAPLVREYEAWIRGQAAVTVDSDERRETQAELVRRAEQARERIEAGITLLATDPDALEAFKVANRAMALAALQRNPERYTEQRPSWRLFQLAFVLLTLRGIAEGTREEPSQAARLDRETVELIFFPTGGGKTEAYLGVIAFTVVLRRLRGRERPDRGLGVAVLLRYTLRLLTLDQLGRAATLMCALETLRRADPTRLGDARFAVGLWVGRSATANTIDEVAQQIVKHKAKVGPSPFPLSSCPWCRKALSPDSLSVAEDRERDGERNVVVACSDWSCAFAAGKDRSGLPILFVDDAIYRELPCFVVATVDKFAMLPWRGETGKLFGRVVARAGRQFLGPLERGSQDAKRLPAGLHPPELIVQDELHLISGPLGTLVGLYETAIESLCLWQDAAGQPVRPKIIASTATVRRAQKQIQALFARRDVAVFPPHGVNASESFFATVDRSGPGRLYVGVAGPGRSMKATLLRAYVSLLTSAERCYDRKGAPEQPADAFMTVAGYFNSLRELGGMRRLVEDDVRIRCQQAEARRPAGVERHPWVSNRTIALEPVELTSRESTHKIASTRARLAQTFRDKEPVDVLLASNMISVGVDIDRLGLMVVAGQPKTTSEYIQASSRVGRASPGLVVTCFNVMKPRDRSHFERFTAYHEAFYRFVEATSVTPFSGPALDRGLTGTLLAIARLSDMALTPPLAAMEIGAHRAIAEAAVDAVATRGGAQPNLDRAGQEALVAKLTDLGRSVVDAWQQIVREARADAAAQRSYSRFDRDRAGKPLLWTILDEEQPPPRSDESKFSAPTSMRDVEGAAHLWLERRTLGGSGRG
jgi:hypothetical protein